MVMFSLTFEEFMADWFHMVVASGTEFDGAFDLDGLGETIHELSAEEGPVLIPADRLEDVGALLLDGPVGAWTWLQATLTEDPQFQANLPVFVWAFEKARRHDTGADQLRELRRSVLTGWSQSAAEVLEHRIVQIRHAEEQRERRRSHVLMTMPELASCPDGLDPAAQAEGRELARRMAHQLLQNLSPAAFDVLREWVCSSGCAKLSSLAARFGTSSATATRAVQLLASLITSAGGSLGGASYRAMLGSLPSALEEAA